MVYKFFDKTSCGGVSESKIILNQQLAGELHKPIIEKIKKQEVYSSFKEKICGTNLADMQLISKYDKGLKYIVCY